MPLPQTLRPKSRRNRAKPVYSGKVGRRIKTLSALCKFHGAVICPACPPWDKPTPTAFIVSMQANRVNVLLNVGLYRYQKAK